MTALLVEEKVRVFLVVLDSIRKEELEFLAKTRKLSKNRVLLELIESGIEAERRKQEQFFALAERFRNEPDPEAASRLGDELGRLVFGG